MQKFTQLSQLYDLTFIIHLHLNLLLDGPWYLLNTNPLPRALILYYLKNDKGRAMAFVMATIFSKYFQPEVGWIHGCRIHGYRADTNKTQTPLENYHRAKQITSLPLCIIQISRGRAQRISNRGIVVPWFSVVRCIMYLHRMYLCI